MREYKPEKGRFTAEDVMHGNGIIPNTLNRYTYCWGNPENIVDNDGKFPIALILVIGVTTFLCGCGSQDEQEPVVQIIEPIKSVDPPMKQDKEINPNNSLETEMIPEQVSIPNPSGQLISNLYDYNIVQRTELIELLETMETFQPKAYYATDNENYKTIGIGHLCDDPTGTDAKYLVEGYVMTYEEAEDLLI